MRTCRDFSQSPEGAFFLSLQKRAVFPAGEAHPSRRAQRIGSELCLVTVSLDRRRYFLQLSLTMLMFVTLRWPCSVAPLSMSFVSSLTFSLVSCMAAARTLPVTVTVWPA